MVKVYTVQYTKHHQHIHQQHARSLQLFSVILFSFLFVCCFLHIFAILISHSTNKFFFLSVSMLLLFLQRVHSYVMSNLVDNKKETMKKKKKNTSRNELRKQFRISRTHTTHKYNLKHIHISAYIQGNVLLLQSLMACSCRFCQLP